MGQFDNVGLKPVSRIGLSDSDRGIGLPERYDGPRPGTTVETKKKPKFKTAAIPPKNPPKNPPKGPTGPKDPDKYNKDNNKNPKKNGYLDKSRKK
jgi:hypothetical protein